MTIAIVYIRSRAVASLDWIISYWLCIAQWYSILLGAPLVALPSVICSTVVPFEMFDMRSSARSSSTQLRLRRCCESMV